VGPTETASESEEATATPEPTVAATEAAAVGWESAFSVTADPPESAIAREVAFGQAGFLAVVEHVIQSEGGPQSTGVSMWLSADGRSWAELAVPIDSEGGNESLQLLATTRAGGYLLFSSIRVDDSGAEPNVTRARLSTDGMTWTDVATGLPESIEVTGIYHGPDASILVGEVFGESDSDTGVWRSEDSLVWERVLDLEEPEAFVTITGAAAGPEEFVIVGTVTALDFGSYDYFALTSSDGREWNQSAPALSMVEGYFLDPALAPLGDGWLVALPTVPDGFVEFWSSADGVAWERAGTIERDEALSRFQPVFAEHDGRVYFSTNGGHPYGDKGIWTSADALTWNEVDLGTDAHLGGMASGSGVIVLHATSLPVEGFAHAGFWIITID
jgi:hypothetical protein